MSQTRERMHAEHYYKVANDTLEPFANAVPRWACVSALSVTVLTGQCMLPTRCRQTASTRELWNLLQQTVQQSEQSEQHRKPTLLFLFLALVPVDAVEHEATVLLV